MMTQSRERLAWGILLLSFALCVGLAVGVPLGVRYLLRTLSVGQKVALEPLEPQQGTLRMQRRGRGDIIALIGRTWDVPPGTVVTTDGSTQGLLTLFTPGQELNAVATVQIYPDTEVVLISARSPRFGVSPLPHRVVLEVRAPPADDERSLVEGRVRVRVSSADGRKTVVDIRTPHLSGSLGAGSYDVRVRNTFSELSVIEGEAQVTSADGVTVALGESQRTVAQAGSAPLEVLPGERNLLRNGNFNYSLDDGWEPPYHEEQQPPAGVVEVVDFEGRQAARFYRNGVGHAEVGIRQGVFYDVRDLTSLVLRLNVRVQGQSLPGCGSAGSECPIIVRVDYKDIYGTDRVWFKGFYSSDPAGNFLLPWDEQVPFQTWYPFDSGNLIDPDNPWAFEEPPALIKAVTIYASGHSFDALVTEVELLAQE